MNFVIFYMLLFASVISGLCSVWCFYAAKRAKLLGDHIRDMNAKDKYRSLDINVDATFANISKITKTFTPIEELVVYKGTEWREYGKNPSANTLPSSSY